MSDVVVRATSAGTEEGENTCDQRSDSEQHVAPERMEVEAIAGSTGRSLARADDRREDADGACAVGVESFHALGATSSAAQHLRRTQSVTTHPNPPPPPTQPTTGWGGGRLGAARATGYAVRVAAGGAQRTSRLIAQ